MLLTLSTTHRPATDLGFLLHKNPARVQTFELKFGRAHVFYPEANEERCTAALMLDVDPVSLVRGKNRDSGGLLTQYVNDRPYASSSFLSVAISRVLGSALGGRSQEREDLARQPIPLSAGIAALPCRGGEPMVRRLFEPLGYEVEVEQPPQARGEYEQAPYRNVRIAATRTLSELLTHVYVLVPVLDNDKHYWVGSDEIDKLIRFGEGWLAKHPDRELIARRYLKHRNSLAKEALARLADGDDLDPDETAEAAGECEQALERPLRLNDVRVAKVTETLKQSGARSVLDLGCGDGRLLRALLRVTQFERILGIDVSPRVLERAAERVNLTELAPRQKARIAIEQGSLTYRDARLSGFDAAAIVEVIEHLDEDRLDAFAKVVFRHARPETVVLTTPNREYNAVFENLTDGTFRHPDHRFEWTRQELEAWASSVASIFSYQVAFSGVGDEHPEHGAPTQMAVFTR